MRYRVHRLNLNMRSEQHKLEHFLNNLEGEVVAIVPSIGIWFLWAHRVNFLLII
jgi:hypothetical protein